jgi:DNA polymerase III subunit delta'
MWKNITGQKQVIEKLISIFSSGRVAHAYLFEGTEGTGKDAAAIEFAKLLNCTNRADGTEACDQCSNCKKINSFRFEYFKFICALPAGKSDDSDSDPIEKLAAGDFDAYLEQLSYKSADPYHQVTLPNANNIRISSIRDLISKIYLSSPKGVTKVFLISEADKMKQEAANALLKILEEPPKSSVIILTTSKFNSLPQTIIGRCQRIHFEALSTEQIAERLAETSEHSAGQIELASRLSFGSYSRARKLLETGIEDIRNTALDYLVALLMDNYAEVVSICRNISARNDKEKTRQFLYFISIWIRDLLRTKNSGDKKIPIVNSDLAERLVKLNKNFPDTEIFRIVMELEEAEKLISQNVQLTLILVNLSFKLKRYFC